MLTRINLYHIIYILILNQLNIAQANENVKGNHQRYKRATRGCHRKFQSIPGHTACLPQSTNINVAEKVGITDEDKRKILQLHNDVRGNVNPPAMAMLKMTWDDEVALVAQAWAENCEIFHDKWYRRIIPGRFTVGQNLAWGWHLTWDGAINLWSKEVENFTHGGRNVLSAVGHYTQMVWENSTKIGCGYAPCGRNDYFVCNYAPAGNLDYNNPYSVGPSCAKCNSRCRNNLCDCGGHVCLNDAVTLLDTCTCICKDFIHYVGDYCALNCELLSEDRNCGIAYQKDQCTVFSNYPFLCPGMCGMCPYGGIAYATIEETEYGTINDNKEYKNEGKDKDGGSSGAIILIQNSASLFLMIATQYVFMQ